MRILITNDDGIQAPGLLPLVQWAKKLGQVTVFAPKTEQSAKSHGIEIRQAFEVKKLELEDVEAYTVDSTPADCVRFAVIAVVFLRVLRRRCRLPYLRGDAHGLRDNR